MDSFLDLLIKACTFAGFIIAALLWVVKRLERGQDELRQHHKEDNERLSESIHRTLKQLSKKLKKKVSKKECKRYRNNCPNCSKAVK